MASLLVLMLIISMSLLCDAIPPDNWQSGGFIQQGSKLVGVEPITDYNAGQGVSISLNAAGDTLASGGMYALNTIGAVYVFVRNGTLWSQQGPRLVGTNAVGYAFQGGSVALSADGNILASGGDGDDKGKGAVWVFTRNLGVWTQQGEKLIGTGANDGILGASQGYHVALDSLGETLASGAYNDNSGIGAVFVFVRNGTTWSQQGPKLVGTGAIGLSTQGSSVALSSDGDTLISGGPEDQSSTGAVWIFTLNGTVWTQQGVKLVGSGASGASHQGNSVALSSDGNILASGGFVDNSGLGAVWVFLRTGTTWTQAGQKLVGSGGIGDSIYLGSSIAMSFNGDFIATGGNEDNNYCGAVWLFLRNSSTSWSQFRDKLVGSDASGCAFQGTGVAMSSDGTTLASGGWRDSLYSTHAIGATWVFEWEQFTSSPTSSSPTTSIPKTPMPAVSSGPQFPSAQPAPLATHTNVDDSTLIAGVSVGVICGIFVMTGAVVMVVKRNSIWQALRRTFHAEVSLNVHGSVVGDNAMGRMEAALEDGHGVSIVVASVVTPTNADAATKINDKEMLLKEKD